jgi:hypothetical protein
VDQLEQQQQGGSGSSGSSSDVGCRQWRATSGLAAGAAMSLRAEQGGQLAAACSELAAALSGQPGPLLAALERRQLMLAAVQLLHACAAAAALQPELAVACAEQLLAAVGAPEEQLQSAFVRATQEVYQRAGAAAGAATYGSGTTQRGVGSSGRQPRQRWQEEAGAGSSSRRPGQAGREAQGGQGAGTV